MTIPLSTLRTRVLTLLDEPANSVEGQQAGGDGTIARPTADTLNEYINQGKDRLVREAFPVPAVASGTWPQGTNVLPFSALATTDRSAPWAALRLAAGGVRLSFARQEHLDQQGLIDAEGPPQQAYRVGSFGVGLAPTPPAPLPVSLMVLVIPPDLSADGDTLAFLTPDLARLVVFYAALMVAKKNAADGTLAPRAAIWEQEWDAGIARLGVSLRAQDPWLASIFFAAGK